MNWCLPDDLRIVRERIDTESNIVHCPLFCKHTLAQLVLIFTTQLFALLRMLGSLGCCVKGFYMLLL